MPSIWRNYVTVGSHLTAYDDENFVKMTFPLVSVNPCLVIISRSQYYVDCRFFQNINVSFKNMPICHRLHTRSHLLPKERSFKPMRLLVGEAVGIAETQCSHFGEFCVTGGTASGQNDNFRHSQVAGIFFKMTFLFQWWSPNPWFVARTHVPLPGDIAQ